MSTRIYYKDSAIQIDGMGPVPAKALTATRNGDRVMVKAQSGYPALNLMFDQYAKEDGSGFASAAAVKTYLDVEFAKAPAVPAHTHAIADVTGLQPALNTLTATGSTNAGAIATANTNIAANTASITSLQSALDGKLNNAFTVSTPTRTLNSNFTPNATKAVLCIYSVKTQVTNPLLVGTSTATVQLLSDTATTPTTERARAEASSGVGITVTVALTTSNTATLTYLCPAGHKVRLASTTSGTGSVSIVSQTEIALG